MDTPYLENNRELWDQWTQLHQSPASDYAAAIERFRAGESVLDATEVNEVGDVAGKSLLHLQCHFGLGTLSWALLGAKVTGVDFSLASIRQAKAFRAEANLEAEFLCADVYRLPEILDQQFDIVYTSDGVLVWLPDLTRWARIVTGFLKPGGIFYLHDFHPLRRVLFPERMDATGEWKRLGYFPGAPLRVEEQGSYAMMETDAVHTAYYWAHTIGEIITALCAAGLKIEYMHEFPKVYEHFSGYVQTAPGVFEMHELTNWAIPNAYSIRATRETKPSEKVIE